ncbi:unnamed protein product [Moneuplotes crassus]|uniref:Amino acid transporter transmembrane domain-containing protein n=1 Tax=Euplotes crassus TaxID=5936 RepID=A0AAD1UBX1_EUPCR|nr:unnamed protein product [Moneuplotes crassus]
MVNNFDNSQQASVEISQVQSQDSEQEKKGGMGVLFCVLTLISIRVSGGVIGISYAAEHIGFTLMFILQALYLPLGVLSCWMLLRAKDITGRASFSDLGIYSYGKAGIYIFNFLIALGNLGFVIIFLIVFGDISSNLLQRLGVDENSFWTTRLCTQGSLSIILLYLMLQKEIHNLRYVGLVQLCICLIFLVSFLIHSIKRDKPPTFDFDIAKTDIDVRFFAVLPTLFTSHGFQAAYFTAFSSLKNKTNRNGMLADFFGRLSILVIFNVTIFIAAALYGDEIKKNLLKSISTEDGILPALLETTFLFVPALAIPVIFFLGKEGALIIFDELTRKSYSKQNLVKQNKESSNSEMQDLENVANSEGRRDSKANSESDQANDTPSENPDASDKISEVRIINPKEYLNMKGVYYYIITITCYVVVLTLSITVQDVTFFFGVAGSTLGSFSLWIGPGSFYILSVHKEKVKLESKLEKFTYVSSFAYVIFGFMCLFGLNTFVILNKF